MSDQIKADWPALQDFSQTQDNWIDYGEAEQALFDALRPELRLLALDHAHQFGPEVAGMVSEVADAAYPKALDHLRKLDHARVIPHDNLIKKLTEWATWWCNHFAKKVREKAARAAVCGRNAADRRAYTLAKYGGPEAEGLGRVRALRKRRAEAIKQARRCATLQRCGWTMARIAQAFSISTKTVQRHLRKHAQRLKLLSYAVRFIDWTFGKDSSCTDPKELVVGTDKKTLPNDHMPQLSRPMGGGDGKNVSQRSSPSEVDLIGEQLGDLLRSYWSKTPLRSPI